MARKIILKEESFDIRSLPLEESPERTLINHKATAISVVADTPSQAWAEILDRLSTKYGTKVIKA